MKIVIRGGKLITQNTKREVIDADVLLENGRIAAIGNVPAQDAARVIDARGMWVLPGFVQAHMHLTQTLFRGLADDKELLPWLQDYIWPLEAAHDPESNYLSAELGISELLLTGTTTVLDMGTTRHHDEVFQAVRDMGIRYFGGKALMDTGFGGLVQPMDAALAEHDLHMKKWHGHADRISLVYAPRFILSCTEPLLRAVGERSRAEGLLIHTHANENKAELDAVRGVTGTTNLRALQARGCLHRGTVIAHGVHVDGDEEACLVESEAAVCHCPGSNLKLASGISPVPRLLDKGVRVALGADGAACDNSLDQRFELRLASLLHRLAGGTRALSAQQTLDLATRGGAAALGQIDQLGSLEVGKRADIVCYRPGTACIPADDVVKAFVYGATDTRVVHSFVGGVQCVREGELLTGDYATLPQRAHTTQNAVKKRAFAR